MNFCAIPFTEPDKILKLADKFPRRDKRGDTVSFDILPCSLIWIYGAACIGTMARKNARYPYRFHSVDRGNL